MPPTQPVKPSPEGETTRKSKSPGDVNLDLDVSRVQISPYVSYPQKEDNEQKARIWFPYRENQDEKGKTTRQFLFKLSWIACSETQVFFLWEDALEMMKHVPCILTNTYEHQFRQVIRSCKQYNLAGTAMEFSKILRHEPDKVDTFLRCFYCIYPNIRSKVDSIQSLENVVVETVNSFRLSLAEHHSKQKELTELFVTCSKQVRNISEKLPRVEEAIESIVLKMSK
ncbi:uncharacterized protein LOC123988470 [Osmia bicornis bicornis]|uniref:uncharacterized protein LOC123988470 n=1 Tax=Osmia bicornis bicornis TaxID=1437191 RepID=UPI001EAF876D|nr:uncharacterized protein LOC123988470 [Osmia bicornis bicornis]